MNEEWQREFWRRYKETLRRLRQQAHEQRMEEIARLEALPPPPPPSWDDLTALAVRDDGAYLVRALPGTYTVDGAAGMAYPVHEVRALTSGGWRVIDDDDPGEAVALQVVACTLAPWRFTRRRMPL